VTVDLGDGAWFNLRTSNTEPLLRLNVEARTDAEVRRIVDQVAQQIGARNGTGG
jgi:phosphomannomutase